MEELAAAREVSKRLWEIALPQIPCPVGACASPLPVRVYLLMHEPADGRRSFFAVANALTRAMGTESVAPAERPVDVRPDSGSSPSLPAKSPPQPAPADSHQQTPAPTESQPPPPPPSQVVSGPPPPSSVSALAAAAVADAPSGAVVAPPLSPRGRETDLSLTMTPEATPGVRPVSVTSSFDVDYEKDTFEDEPDLKL
jgi:hypothetical protein